MWRKARSVVWHRTLAIALLLLVRADAAAQPAEQFFARKTVTITIGYTAGGSYDLYGRMVARHLGKHIPGQPTLIAQNMPGAGSLKAANYLYEVAPKDGTALGVVGRIRRARTGARQSRRAIRRGEVHLCRPRRHQQQHLHAVAHRQGAVARRRQAHRRPRSPAPARDRSRRPCRGS